MRNAVLALSVLVSLAACGEETQPRRPSGGGPPPPPPPPPDLPTCVDEAYDEPLPTAADITALVDAYDPTVYRQFISDALSARYSTGAYIVEEAVAVNPTDCVDRFAGDTSSARAVLRRPSTLVHECGHYLDRELSSFSLDVYVFTQDTQLTCERGDSVARGGNTFARSRIRNDAFSAGYPPCNGGFGDCDFYADVYLDGDADNATFESGDQGFNMLLEEAVQYINSLATDFAFVDYEDASATSARDGILVLLWYLERYLHMARLDYPSAYAFLAGDACWRNAILTTWGRAWILLSATAGIAKLGIDDDLVEPLVLDPVLLDEIERVRVASGCRDG